jgi:hypothetical protein
MPRNGGGIYSKGSPSVVTGTTIQSAAYNTTIDDLVTDANAARPISAGGTGAANAADARTNLGISATNTPFTPAGNIAASNVQAALAELDAEKATPAIAYRNRIINPGMQISQELGTALVDVTTSNAYSVDQWFANLSTTPGGTLRVQQVASITPGGSPFRLRHTAQVADASIAAGDVYAIGHIIEGQMIADARFGTASARQIVIRFGVQSSLAGTFGVRLINSAANRSYVTTITIAGGEINTDLVRTIVIPGDTSGTWLTDTGAGLNLTITLAAGTTWQTTAGSWQAGNFHTTSGQTNFMGTGSATFELFDVGLYVDALNIGAAPSWELPAWDADLRACQRYYQLVTKHIQAPGASSMSVPFLFPVQMRTPPVRTLVSAGIVSSATVTNDAAGLTQEGFYFQISASAAGGFAVDRRDAFNARF